MREDDGHASGGRRHRLDHVLHPGVVAVLGRWHAGEVPAVRIAGPDLVPPLFEREGGIGEDAIESGEIVTGEERRLAKCVAADYLEIGGAMQKQVHPRNGGCGEVLLLGEELAPQRAVVTMA